MKKLLTICLMLLGAVAQAQNFAITATTEAAIRKNIVKGNAANYGFGMINDTLKLVGLTTRNVIFTGSTSKTDIGLGNVDNTSDLNKPVSTATQTALNLKQNQLNGTGFVKATGTTISYDNSTYLSTSSASSTYLPISNPTATGTLTAPTIANSLGATFATTSGNVGIGTTAPTEKLEVFNGNYTNLKISANQQSSIKLNMTTLYGVNNPNVELYNNYGNVGLTLYPTPTATRNDIIYYDNTDKETQFQTDGSTKLRIRGNGNVLIGTPTDAGYKLDVNGNARFSNSSSTGGIEIGQTGLTAKLQYNVNGNLDITPRTGYNTIFTAGNVGIGTLTPNAKLDVAGNVFASGSNTVVSGTTGVGIGTSGGYPQISLRDNAGATDTKNWDTYAAGTIMYSRVINDSNISAQVWQQVQRSGATVSSVSFPNGKVGIGTTSPNASSILDITSTTKGVLFPRMTTTEISAIASPADGLTVYNTTLKAICFYDAGAAVWKRVSHSNM